MNTREFEKIYNRDLPLFSAEYWYRGERFGLPRITRKSIYYNPLFVYRRGRGTDVYYDVTNYEKNARPIPSFFAAFPERFEKIASDYWMICQKMKKWAREKRYRSFSQVFEAHLFFWPRLAVIVSLGDRFDENRPNPIYQRAYELRKKTDDVEYISGNQLLELAKKMIPGYESDIYFLTSKEIIGRKIPPLAEMEERRKGYIFYTGKLYPGLKIRTFQRMHDISFLRRSHSIPRHILEGITASKGKVVGRARIILNLDNLDKLQEKEILVTSMTTPDHLLAMEKARAFVTNEGGVTCHAAIVAREMKKPCIVATRVATEVIRNGDLVEVDATGGFVKIIQRAKRE